MTTALAQVGRRDIVPLPDQTDLEEVRLKAASLRALLDPEWRYTRSRSLNTEGVVHFRSSEDPWVAQFVSFLRRYGEATPQTMGDVEYQFPDIHWAFRVYSMEIRGPRYHLEAMTLTGLPVDEIAEYLGLPMAVVLAYEQLFFDLRRHVERPEAIRTYIAAKARARGMRDMDPDPFWKRVALSEGETMLFSLWNDGVMEEGDRKRIDALIESDSRRNTLEAMRVRHINSANAHEIVEEYIALCRNEIDRRKVEADLGAAAGGEQEFVAGLFHAVQFSIAPVGKGSEKAYVELTSALAQAPALLARLQGTTSENGHADKPK
jgi:hypothetical protein